MNILAALLAILVLKPMRAAYTTRTAAADRVAGGPIPGAARGRRT
jgi:hypothetical protein